MTKFLTLLVTVTIVMVLTAWFASHVLSLYGIGVGVGKMAMTLVAARLVHGAVVSNIVYK